MNLLNCKKILLLSGSSNSGKTVLANGLIRLFKKKYFKNVQFYKSLSISENTTTTKEGITTASFLEEYSDNANVKLSIHNNTLFFNKLNQSLYLHGDFIASSTLISSDNIDVENLNYEVIQQIKSMIISDVNYLSSKSDLIVFEGGGNCLYGGDGDISNLWLSANFNIPIVFVVEGKDGGGFLSILGIYHRLPEKIKKLVFGFVINGLFCHSNFLQNEINFIEKTTQWKCLGTIPWMKVDSNCSLAEWQEQLEIELLKNASDLINLIINKKNLIF